MGVMKQPIIRLSGRRRSENTKSRARAELPVCMPDSWNHMESNGLIYAITHRDNLNEAFKRVKRNKEAAGVDAKDIEATRQYLKEEGNRIIQQIETGRYTSSPVRRVEIPKDNGGKRKLGIPTVTDRVIQQAVVQVLSPIFEETFSEHSYEFRPNRSAHQAIEQARTYIDEGYRYVVDIDLEKIL